jgi:hypothetical protein
MKNIRWDEHEKDVLAQHVAIARLHDLDAPLTTLLNKAISILPEHRRRSKLATHKLVAGFDKMVRKHVDVLLNKTTNSAIKYVEKPLTEVLPTVSIGVLVEEIFNRMKTEFRTALREAYQGQAMVQPCQQAAQQVAQQKLYNN